MRIGCVKEVKDQEYRVGLTPACVRDYVRAGHKVAIQSGAGEGAGFPDAAYLEAGAELLDTAKDVFDRSDMIVKVKEPVASEYDLFREGQILYTYLHLAADRPLTEMLLVKKIQAIAYETMQTPDGRLPCLKPMSEIAGRLSVQEGAKCLLKTMGGAGILLGGVPGVPRAKVLILGGGTVGANACRIAYGMGADVTVLDLNAVRLEYLDDIYGGKITTLYSTEGNLTAALRQADLVVGAVLVPGAAAPRLIRREHLQYMKKGAVLVDVAIDQGGCIETSHPTTHTDPVFVVDGVVHYCVANMPGAVPRTATMALTSATLNYGLEIASKGVDRACRDNPVIATGLNTYQGRCVCRAVAQALGLAME